MSGRRPAAAPPGGPAAPLGADAEWDEWIPPPAGPGTTHPRSLRSRRSRRAGRAGRAPGRRRIGRRRFGLRARVTMAFALGALILSGAMSGLSYGLVRNYLLDQREKSVIREAYLNASIARDRLAGPAPDLPRVLDAMQGPESPTVIFYDERWFSSEINIGQANVPASLRRLVRQGEPGRQAFSEEGRSQLAVGVPIPQAGAMYFELFDQEELARTLSFLGFALVGAGLATTVAGAAVGRWASTRLLRPVADVAQAAAAIAGGDLTTRLEGADDVDLAVLVSSFNSMVDALRARIERDARFASDVSHELRSPLTTLATSVGVLASRREELSDRSRAAFDLLEADVARFQRLVEDLLEISRFDAGVAELHVDEVMLHELVRAVVERSPYEVPVAVDPGAEEVVVRVDKRRLAQVIANLLENAARYGGGATRVTVQGGRLGARVMVDDEGPGVPPDERSAVFERFFRGATSGRRRSGGQGSGLGLSLVAEHVRLHGGRVFVEDGPGGVGARFVVELPVVPA